MLHSTYDTFASEGFHDEPENDAILAKVPSGYQRRRRVIIPITVGVFVLASLFFVFRSSGLTSSVKNRKGFNQSIRLLLGQASFLEQSTKFQLIEEDSLHSDPHSNLVADGPSTEVSQMFQHMVSVNSQAGTSLNKDNVTYAVETWNPATGDEVDPSFSPTTIQANEGASAVTPEIGNSRDSPTLAIAEIVGIIII